MSYLKCAQPQNRITSDTLKSHLWSVLKLNKLLTTFYRNIHQTRQQTPRSCPPFIKSGAKGICDLCTPQQLPVFNNFTSVSSTWLLPAGMAALWARLRSSLPVKACEGSLRNMTLLGKNMTPLAKQAASSIPKGMDFPRVWDQIRLHQLLPQRYILFKVVTAFSDLCNHQSAQMTRTWAQVRQLCRKNSRKGCSILFT